MVKLRKAFSLHIHLHIRQDMLQRLWDKYVPADSPEYGQIELIYLGEQARGGRAQLQQANLSVSLLFKNRIMQMGLEKCPVKTAYVREQMENSLQRMERYYLTQLKCCNFVMYRKAERFLTLINQAQTERDRYLKWQKDSRYMKDQREKFHVFSRFAVNLREFLTEHSQRTMRAQERELLHLLSKKEYREFCRLCRLENELELADIQSVKWKKNKEKMLQSIEGLETVKIRRLWGQMERLVTEKGTQDTVLMHKLTQIHEQYRREIVRGFWEHVLSVLDSGELQAAVDMAKISPVELRRQLAIESQEQMSEEKSEYVSEERAYLSEFNSVERLERKTEYALEERAYLSGRAVSEFLRHIESVLEIQRSRMVQQESKMFASYQEIYQEVFASVRRQEHLEDKTSKEMVAHFYQLREEKKEEFVEELAKRILLQQQGRITKEEDSRGSFGYTGREIDGLISYIVYVIEKKSRREAGVTEETTEKMLTHLTETEEREVEELFAKITSVIEKGTSVNTDLYKVEEVEEILSYIVDKGEEQEFFQVAQTVFAATEQMRHSVDGQEERKMLLYLRNVEEEKRTEFVQALADTIFLRRQTYMAEERFFGYTEEQIEGLLSYVSHVAESKIRAGEIISRESETTDRRAEEAHTTEEIYVVEEAYTTEEIRETELAEKEAGELFMQIASVIKKRTSLTEGYTETRVEEIRKMLLYLHNMEEERRAEFIEKLAERMLLQQIHVTEEQNTHKILNTQILNTQEELSHKTVESIEENAEIFGYTEEQIEGLLSYVSYVAENKKKTEEILETKFTGRETEELFLQIESVIENETLVLNTVGYEEEEVEEIRRVLSYLHDMKGERRIELIEKLAERMLLQQNRVTGESNFQKILDTQEELSHRKADTQEEFTHRIVDAFVEEFAEREAEELYVQLFSVMEEKRQESTQRGITGRQDIPLSVSAPYEKLWEWGKALLFYPEQEKALQEADILPAGELPAGRERMEGRAAASYSSEDRDEMQTEIIRRQIEAAKDRNTLLQLIYQINHRIAMTQEEEKEEQEPEEKLIYADSQLNLPQVKNLLNFVNELDEGQYGKLVEELSEVTKLQWQLHLQGAEEIEIAQIKHSVADRKNTDRELLPSAWTPVRLGNQYLTVAYPALVYQIEEFETYRQREVRDKIRSLGRSYLQLTDEEAVQISAYASAPRKKDREIENIWRKEGQTLDLEYNRQAAAASEDEQRQDQARMREENAQLRQAQEQIGKKLKEVEVQLQKVETSARAKEDVRAFAEQVKSQLYEELHVEKLRRGLI